MRAPDAIRGHHLVRVGTVWFQNIRKMLSHFRFWIVLNSIVSLGLVLFVCLSTNWVVKSIDSEDRALVNAYSDDLQDINNLNIELHRYNTDTLAYILIGDQTLLPKIETRTETLKHMMEHIEESHPSDYEGMDMFHRLQAKFAERDNFIRSMIEIRESGADVNDIARRIYIEGRPITTKLQEILDAYTTRRFSFLEKSRDHIDRENAIERNLLSVIQITSLAIGLLLAVTLGKILSSFYRKSKSEADIRREALAIAAHDLKNPIANILGSLEIIRSTSMQTSRDKDAQLMDIIERAAQSMRQLVYDYLEDGKLEAGKLIPRIETIAVGELVANVLQSMRPTADQHGTLIVSDLLVPPGQRVVCDPQMLMQVFSNLVGNALKFSPRGSIVVLRVESGLSGLQFSVIDSGPGIPNEMRRFVFEKYWQQKSSRKGSGLGLSIAKGIVEAHSGQIWVDQNENGVGSRFSFSLPDGRLEQLQDGSFGDQSGPRV